VWWVGSWDSRNSPLGRLLFCRDEHGNIAPQGTSTPGDPEVVAKLRALAQRAPQCIEVEPSRRGLAISWSPPQPQTQALAASSFDRSLDLRWRRTSYSDITAASHEAWVGSEPEEPLIADEPLEAEPPAALRRAGASPGQGALATASLLAEMPVGAQVGTFVHRVLQVTDFDAPDLPAELGTRLAEVQGRRAVDVGDAATVVAGLEAVLQTPLGPVLASRRLCDIGRADRLDELEFELPLAGGDRPAGTLTLSRLASVLRDRLAPEDPLVTYANRLEDPRLRQTVRGYLTGSLDLVVRVRTPESDAGRSRSRYAVLDYKTNWLGEPDAPLTVGDYRPVAVMAEMHRHHYALQALLYTVALHRYLRWRVSDYDPELDLAGVIYLFVRGMIGPSTPVIDETPCGVFGWRAPAGLVGALSDALEGSAAPAAAGRTT
jgi:exodeoxyribonuclease V beta subunit